MQARRVVASAWSGLAPEPLPSPRVTALGASRQLPIAGYCARNRNRQLQQELLAAASSAAHYRRVQEAAQALLAGTSTPGELWAAYKEEFGTSGVAIKRFARLADLVPSAAQRRELRRLAGLPMPSRADAPPASENPAATGHGKATRCPDGGALPASLQPQTAGAHGNAAVTGVLYWIRQDFRLHDNPALSEAARIARETDTRVVCAFIHSPGAAKVVSPSVRVRAQAQRP